MPLLKWSPELTVYVKEFDAQHQRLVAILNELYDAMQEGKGRDVMGNIFGELIEYTQVHFAAEERLMQMYSYHDLASHKAEHDDLTRQALDLQKKFQSGSVFISIETLTFLREWLAKHILETDRHYGAFFNGKGVN